VTRLAAATTASLALGAALLGAGCARPADPHHAAMVTDAQRCERDASRQAGTVDNTVRLLMLRSCMALLGWTER
jgi:hypothetical protein